MRDLLQLAAVIGLDDLATDATAARCVGHEHAVSPRQRQVGGERRALVAALLLDDLHQHDLPALDHLLDLVAAQQSSTTAGLIGHHLGGFLVRVGGDGLGGLDVACGLRLGVRTAGLGRCIALDVLQERAVCLRHLVVVGMDLAEGEEAVTVAAILDEGGLQRGLHPRDLREVDVALQLELGRGLEVEVD